MTALVTVVKFAIFWAFGFAIFIFFGPIENFIRYKSGLWNGMPADVLGFGDQAYAIWTAFVVIIPAILIIMAWREAERKAAGAE